MSVTVLNAEKRGDLTKGDVKALRAAGKIPAVVYGEGKDGESITIDAKELFLAINKGRFKSRLLDIKLGKESISVLPRDVQFHPVKSTPQHADFQRIAAGSTVNVFVPLAFNNHEKSPGLKRGGILNVVRHDMELICQAEKIPSVVEVDLTGLEIGDSIHVETVDLGDGVETAIKRNFTLATVVGRLAKEDVIEPADEGAEDAEGEGEGEAGSEEESKS